MDHSIIARNMKAARKNAGLSIEAASELSGLSKMTIIRIEHDTYKCLYLSTVMTLCETYGISLEDAVME